MAYLKKIERHPYIELVAYYLKELERHAHTSRRRRDRISKWWHITSMRRRERMPGLEVIVSCPLLKMLSVLGGSSDL